MYSKIEAVIFDLGGTLINYEGMPYYWGNYYEEAFQRVKRELLIDLSEKQIQHSVEILKKYNPRIYPREIEYNYKHIFIDITEGWSIQENDINEIVKCFFEYFRRNVIVYDDTFEILKFIKSKGLKTGILTDLPTGMPDELVYEEVAAFKELIDCWVSSEKCGFRKPNRAGLDMVAEKLQIDLQNIIFIGDEKKDIEAAKNAGCISILLNRNGERKDYGQKYQLSDLLGIVNILNI